ncbi:MAG: lactate utilization protein [Desulfobacterales bacterium]|nr:lactate utilization protein [Desulfobacterales bacterium]
MNNVETMDLTQTMTERAEKIQAKVSLVKDFEEIFTHALAVTKEQGGKTLAAPGLDPAAEERLAILCTEAGIELLRPPLRDHLENIHTGLTLADWGVAETGTLVVNSADEDLRIATMLSETHVAILPRWAIHPDMDSLAEQMDGILKADPAYLAFISGPSRTADIERVLAIGVHGPRELHILIMDQE